MKYPYLPLALLTLLLPLSIQNETESAETTESAQPTELTEPAKPAEPIDLAAELLSMFTTYGNSLTRKEFVVLYNNYQLPTLGDKDGVGVAATTNEGCDSIVINATEIYCGNCSVVDGLFNRYAPFDMMGPANFIDALPALVLSLKQEQCFRYQESQTANHYGIEPLTKVDAFVYSLGMMSVVCLVSYLGAFLVPIMRKRLCYKYVFHFLMATSIGSHVTIGILILLPESMGLMHTRGTKDIYYWKCLSSIAGILYALFLYEMIKVFSSQAHTHSNEYLMEQEQTDEISMYPDDVDIDGATKVHDVSLAAWMVMLSGCVIKLVEGVSIGIAFSISYVLGLTLSLSIVCEEIPHILGDMTFLLRTGMPVRQALYYVTLVSIWGYPAAMGGVYLGEIPEAKGWVLAFTSGIFIFVPIAGMFPELTATISKHLENQKDVWHLVILEFVGLAVGVSSIAGVVYLATRSGLF